MLILAQCKICSSQCLEMRTISHPQGYSFTSRAHAFENNWMMIFDTNPLTKSIILEFHKGFVWPGLKQNRYHISQLNECIQAFPGARLWAFDETQQRWYWMYANLMSWAQQVQFHEAGMVSWLVKCKNILTSEISDKKKRNMQKLTQIWEDKLFQSSCSPFARSGIS